VIRLVKNSHIDIILCEYHLDEVRDGQQLLEELRQKKLISLSTVFMMITNESNYKQVISVAEFAPDDYLLKPFTPEQLNQRLLRAIEEKTAFSSTHKCLDKGKTQEALVECDKLLREHPKFIATALRLKINILHELQRHDEAEALLQKIMSTKMVPWAQMGLASIRYKQNRLDEAEDLVSGLVSENHEYLAAYDLLADVKCDLGKEHEALDVLERAASISTFNVNRMRKTAAVAASTGDHTKAAQLLNKVVDRVRDSSLISTEDFANLSKAYVAQGKFEEAAKVSNDMKQTMKGTPDMEITALMIEYQRHLSSNDTKRADEALLKAVEMQKNRSSAISPAMEAELAEACFARNHIEQGFNIAQKVAARKDVPKPIVNRISALLDQYREGQESRRDAAKAEAKPATHGKVDLGDLLATVKRLDIDGWDQDTGQACRISLERSLRQNPGNLEVQAAHTQMVAVMRKYGISATLDEEEVEVGGKSA